MAKSSRVFVGVLPALLLSTLVPMTVAADSPRGIAKRVSPSVVLLVMEDTNGQPLGMGSGFIVRDGIVATNMHVINGAARGYAKLVGDKTRHDIRGVVASDEARDLVLLSIDGLKANPLVIGDSSQVAVGDAVFAVGNPRGLQGTFSAGIVSSIRKVGEDSLLQITAPISPGSSGGPVVNNEGEVIGIAVATFKGGQNLNFAIPGKYLSSLMPAIAVPVRLPQAAEARRGSNERTILDDMGGRSTDGVIGAAFLWDNGLGQTGKYSFTLRNKLRDSVKQVICLVVFVSSDGEPLDTDLVSYSGSIPAGLAHRMESRVAGSVQVLMCERPSDLGQGKLVSGARIEFRILYFDIVSPDEPLEAQSAAPRYPRHPFRGKAISKPVETARVPPPASQVEDEVVAKVAPAGDGPDLIQSHIKGKFEGWDGDTIFELDNGQIWQQVRYAYTYHYAYRPSVTIIKSNGAHKMKVDGVSTAVVVRRLR